MGVVWGKSREGGLTGQGITMAVEDKISELEQQATILNRLLDVSVILNSNLALKPLLQFIMSSVCEITDSEAASILLYDGKADQLRFVASNTPGTNIEELDKIPVPMEGSKAGEIFRENRPVMVQDASAADAGIYRPVDTTIGFVTRSLLGVPMRVKEGDPIGVLEAVNKKQGEWTDNDRNHLSILAAQAAVAIQNAQQAEALQKAYDELDQLDKLKNDFIAVASHELRTPLGVILGYASFLKEELTEDNPDSEANEHAEAVLNSALHLRSLIEDMLNLRYLHLGKADLTLEQVPISAVIQLAEYDVQSMAEAKDDDLVINLGEAGDTLVNVDRMKVGMALTNILNNAVKFTPNKGEIRIDLERRRQEIWVKISDNGVGIPSEQLETIFDEFHQVEDHMTRRHNGMGLGLSIARGMVQAHEGRVWAESEGSNKGSTFYVVLPVAQPGS